MMGNRVGQAAVVAGLVVFCGCSGDEPPTAPPVAAPPSAPPPTVAAAGGQRNPQRPRVPTREPEVEEKREPELPDVPPSQLFLVRDTDPGVELVPPEVAAERDLYAITSPEVGLNSSTVRIVAPEGEQSPGQPRPPSAPVSLPEGFAAVPDGGYAEDGMPLRIRCAADDSLMVYVPGGLFLQGADGVDSQAGPAHPVELSPFYIDQTEVTLRQFERFRAEHMPRPEPSGNAGSSPDHPVVGIPWRSARAYCSWSGKELPTEAEWEKAGRGPDGYLYPWGDGRVIWERARTTDQIDPVMSFRMDRSVYGVFDLAGNAREWCADHYAPDSYARALERSGGLVKDPEGPSRPSVSGHRVIRGNAPHWELWFRSSASVSSSPGDVGFRGVLRISLPEEGETAGDTGNRPPATRVPGTGGTNRGDRGF